jgi:NAD(P)-dependent dehydrogenase (short-subunit alcohol dehydrogenase family)
MIPSPRAAVVTGAASGIGRAAVEMLMAAGVPVLAVDLAEPPVGDARLTGDVTDPDLNRTMIDTAIKEFGDLEAVILNAGIRGGKGRLDEFDLDEWDRVMDINLRSVLLGIRASVPTLRARGGGAITVTASYTGFETAPSIGPYPTSKAAVLGLMRQAAVDFAADHIRVNAVCPGVVHTGITTHLHENAAAEAWLTGNMPSGRWGRPEEIAAAIAFLSSPAASYISGVALSVDGGQLALGSLYRPLQQLQ